MLKKVLKVALCCALLAVVVVATAHCDTEKKVLKVGMECANVPYNWSQPTSNGGALPIADSDEYAYGYDVILSKKLADAMGLELEIYKIEWGALPPAVVAGKVDAIVTSMSITDIRKLTVDFTEPYYCANVVGLVRKDSPQVGAKSLADLKGCRVTSQMNTLWYSLIDQIPEVEKLPALDTITSGFVLLQSDNCDMIVVDTPTALAAAYANPELTMLDFPAGQGFETTDEDIELCIAVRKGDADLMNAMNSVLATMTDEDRKAIMEEAVKKQPLMQ